MAQVFYIPNGTKNLQTLFPAVNFRDLSHYYIQVRDTSGAIIATGNINELTGECPDDKVRIHFLNSLGAIDAITFKIRVQEHETKSDTRERQPGYPLNKPDHGINRFNTRSNDTYTLVNCEYTENQKDWLDVLFDSPVAWMEWAGTQNQPDSYIPVVIIDKKFTKLKEEDRFIYEVVLEIQLSHEKLIIRN